MFMWLTASSATTNEASSAVSGSVPILDLRLLDGQFGSSNGANGNEVSSARVEAKDTKNDRLSLVPTRFYQGGSSGGGRPVAAIVRSVGHGPNRPEAAGASPGPGAAPKLCHSALPISPLGLLYGGQSPRSFPRRREQ